MSIAAAPGCGPNARLLARVDLLERELGDARSAHRRLESRLDEVQIQFELLRRAGGRPAPAQIPKLPVVKVGPQPPPTPGSRSRSVDLGPEVDPAQVSERLPVDREASENSIEARDAMASQSLEVRDEGAAASHRLAATAFEKAFGLYRTNAFSEAATALVTFADRHPEHPLAPEALFYAGRAELILGKLADAEREFLKVARSYPMQERSAEALLMAGNCQERQGRTEDARGTYLQLVDAFPLSEHARIANGRLEAIR